MSSALIDLTKQCCDADEYLDMGYLCAQTGDCYNPLRPIGDTLWFAFPYLLNTSENIFFYIHLFLLSLVGLTTFRLLTITSAQDINAHRRSSLITGLSCLFVMALVFLIWPTFFHTLSDTPATLLFIEGILLTLLGMTRNCAASYFAAGIFLGLSALLRTAYFMPLLLSGTLFSIYWLWQFFSSQKKHLLTKLLIPSILILSFIIPLLFQFFLTWKHTGQWSFISEARSRSMMSLHLNSSLAGYDTQLPQTKVFWSPDCSASNGLLPALRANDISSISCIFKNRLKFHLGSYSPHTYLDNKFRNFLNNDYAEKIGHTAGWSLHGIQSELHAALSPLNDKTASRLVLQKDTTDSEYFIESRSLIPLPTGEYRYSIWLWKSSDNYSTTLDVQLNSVTVSRSTYTNAISLAINSRVKNSITLGDKPQQYTFNINNTSAGYIVARINAGGNFNAWGAALEPTRTAIGYIRAPQELKNNIGQNALLSKEHRSFSNLYLIINLLVILVAFFFLLKFWIKTRSSVVIFISALLCAVLIQSLIIIPEQRYLQGFLAACWLMCVLSFSNRRQNP